MTASIVDAKDDCLWIHGKKVLEFSPYVTEVKQITTSKGEKREYRIQIHRNGEVEKEGWFEEMCRKTLIREVYSAKHLPRDPQKIDDAYQFMKAREARFAEIQAQAEIDAQANIIPIDTTPTAPAALGAPPQPVTIPETNPDRKSVV